MGFVLCCQTIIYFYASLTVSQIGSIIMDTDPYPLLRFEAFDVQRETGWD